MRKGKAANKMRVKNITFSGFMSAILMLATGVADAAVSVNLTSKTYVDNALAGKQNVLEAGEGIEITDNVIKSTIDTSKFALKDDVPGLSMFVTDDELAQVEKALRDEIAAKQSAGDYATASQLQELQQLVAGLQQAGTADKAVVDALKSTVDMISADYAKKSDLSATEANLRSAIDSIVIPVVPKLISAFENDAGYITAQALDGYAKTADVEAKYATNEALQDYAKSEDLQDKADSKTVADLQNTVNNIENTYLTQEVAQNTYATTQQVTEQISNVVGTDTSGLKKQVADNTLAIAEKANASDVENLYATKESLKGFAKVEDLGLKADSEAVTNLQKAVNNIENTYLTQEVAQNTYATTQQVTEQISNVVGTDTSGLKKQVADNTLAIAEKANASDVYSKSVSDSMFLKKGDDAELGANLQWDSDGKLNTRGIATAEGLKELEDKVADAVTETELEAKGYQTASDVRVAIAGKADSTTVAADINVALKEAKDYADSKTYNDAALVGRVDTLEKAGYQTAQQVQGAITTATADLATKAEVNAKQNKLTAGQNITINGDTISSDIDLSGYALKTDVPSVVGLATSEQLKDLQDTLQEAIDAKQAKGEYAAAADLTELQKDVTALQTDAAKSTDVSALAARVKTIEDTYATDAELTQAIEGVKALIPNTENFATKDDLSAVLSSPQNPGMGEYVLYASCTAKKCNYSLMSLDSLVGSGNSNVGGM